MKEWAKFVIAIVIPTIILYVWSLWAIGCAFNMTSGISRCSIPVSSALDIPLIAFALYTVFYCLATFLSGYRFSKKK